VRQLAYKAQWYGRTLIKIDRWFPSSKTCSCCSYVLESLDLEVRAWMCPNCGAHHDRDVNAANSVKQERMGSTLPMKLSQYENQQGISYSTALRWWLEARDPRRPGPVGHDHC
jgi:predicted RNA-binding Zn-ribbon protein involved in translation (DUF1610 family)